MTIGIALIGAGIPNGRPRHHQDAPACAGVTATPPRRRPDGRDLTPTPHTGAIGSDAEPPTRPRRPR
jgi:hypothetical protein